jgi:hypothetical protein
MLRMCVYMHSRFVENHPIQILEDGPLIFEVVLSHFPTKVHQGNHDQHGYTKGGLDTILGQRLWAKDSGIRREEKVRAGSTW